MSCSHQERRDALLQRIFSGEGNRAEESELLGLAASCEACGAAYDRMNDLERQLDGGDVLSNATASRVFERVMAATAGESDQPHVAEVVPLRRRTPWIPLALAAGVAAIAAPTLLSNRQSDPARPSEYTARGGEAKLPGFSARAFCVPPAPAAPQELGPNASCEKSAELAFSASNAGEEALQVTVRRGDAAVGASPVTLAAGATDEALPVTVKLGERTAGEQVKVSVCASGDCRDFEVRVR